MEDKGERESKITPNKLHQKREKEMTKFLSESNLIGHVNDSLQVCVVFSVHHYHHRLMIIIFKMSVKYSVTDK